MKRLIAFFICLLAADAYAQQRIPDLSLSPEETYQDFGIQPRQNNGNNSDSAFGPDNGGSYGRSGSGYNSGSEPATPSDSFMEGYCSQDFRPVVQNHCADAQREKICDQFSSLPADAQAALDNMIACLQSDLNTSGNNSACADNNTERLRLIRKYWKDEVTSHALASLPEDMLRDSTACANGGN